MARPATTYRGNRRRAEKLAQKARQPTDRKKRRRARLNG